jgi:hypothetical protein
MRFSITLRYGNMEQDIGFTRLIEDERPNALDYAANRSYHCPQCGHVWALWTQEQNIDELPKEWYPSRRSCPDHRQGYWSGDRAGSLILSPNDICVLPRVLLEHELLLITEPK